MLASIGSSWLYSTGMSGRGCGSAVSSGSGGAPTTSRPSIEEKAETGSGAAGCMRASTPSAILARRGIVTNCRSRPRAAATPSEARYVEKYSVDESWKRKSHRRPSRAHRAAMPDACSSAWISPWPCGLVCTRYGPSGAKEACGSESAATLFCRSSVTCDAERP